MHEYKSIYWPTYCTAELIKFVTIFFCAKFSTHRIIILEVSHSHSIYTDRSVYLHWGESRAFSVSVSWYRWNVVCTCNQRCHFTSDLTQDIPMNCVRWVRWVRRMREWFLFAGLLVQCSGKSNLTHRWCTSDVQRELLSNHVEVITYVSNNRFCCHNAIIFAICVRFLYWEIHGFMAWKSAKTAYTYNNDIDRHECTCMLFRMAALRTSSSNNLFFFINYLV